MLVISWTNFINKRLCKLFELGIRNVKRDKTRDISNINEISPHCRQLWSEGNKGTCKVMDECYLTFIRCAFSTLWFIAAPILAYSYILPHFVYYYVWTLCAGILVLSPTTWAMSWCSYSFPYYLILTSSKTNNLNAFLPFTHATSRNQQVLVNPTYEGEKVPMLWVCPSIVN